MKIFKHVISAITLIYLILVIYSFWNFEINDNTIHTLLFTTYALFSCIVLVTFRISLIGKNSINWISLALTLLILTSLFLMEKNKDLVHSFWDFTLIGFAVLSAISIFQIIPKNRSLTLISKITTILISVLFSTIIIFKIGSPTLFYVVEWLIIALSLMLIINFFIKPKKA